MVSIQKNIYQLRKFRKRFKGELNEVHIESIFGVKIRGKNKEERKAIWRDKLEIAEQYIDLLRIFNWVKYIAVTGSVAAEVAKENDDIDIFVVVKNDRMWLYRGLMMINPRLRQLSRRAGKREESNSICLNFICEERGLEFDNDIFNFHELYFMKSIYNPDYKDYILSRNLWIKGFRGVIKQHYIKEKSAKQRNLLLNILNIFAFYAQYLFMKITRHKPEYQRLVENNKKGRIEFFLTDFKESVLSRNN